MSFYFFHVMMCSRMDRKASRQESRDLKAHDLYAPTLQIGQTPNSAFTQLLDFSIHTTVERNFPEWGVDHLKERVLHRLSFIPTGVSINRGKHQQESQQVRVHIPKWREESDCLAFD